MSPGASIVGRFMVTADHPALPGHFPGQPIVPGVVLLDHVLEFVLGSHQEARALLGVKFLAVVRPNEIIEVSASPLRNGRIGFAAARDGEPVLRGTVEIAPPTTARSGR